jgi:hypothetical protein
MDIFVMELDLNSMSSLHWCTAVLCHHPCRCCCCCWGRLAEFLALGNDERLPPALPAINLLTGVSAIVILSICWHVM